MCIYRYISAKFQQRRRKCNIAASYTCLLYTSEPEVIPQEVQQEISQPEKPMQPGDMYITEILMSMREENKKTKEENRKNIESLKEDLNSRINETSQSTNQKIEESQKSTDQKIESLKEDNRTLKEELNLSLIHI